MSIFFRYLFIRLLVPFMVCLFGCTVIWIMVDLYGNMDDFLEHKINVLLILRFYFLLIPSMLVLVLPAALLFSTLWTLLSLNRRCELVAFQSGGLAPIWLFSPFFVFAAIWMAVLAYDLSGPAAKSEVTRQRLLQQVKGGDAKGNKNLPYVDTVNHWIWMLSSLDTGRGTAQDLTLTQQDANGHDLFVYGSHEAQWTGSFWRMTGVTKIIFGPNNEAQGQKKYETLDLPDVTTPPQQLSLIISQPEQLTLSGLSEYIRTSTSSPVNLAQYRTEWWYRVLYPFSLIVLMLFALLQGIRTDRRSPVAGVVWSVVVLLIYLFFINGCMALGRHNRLPPFLSVISMEVIFAGIALFLLARQQGWWWQVLDLWKKWKAERAEDSDDELVE